MIALRSPRSRRVAAIASFAAALAVASCTLLGSRDVIQCDSDSDCAQSKLIANGPAVCIDNLCATRVTPVDVPDGSDAADAQGDATTACKDEKGCPDNQRCVEGACTLLFDENGPCPRVANNDTRYQEPGALIVGAYVYSPKSNGAEVKAIELALQQINDALPKESKIALVFCSKQDKLAKGSAQAAVNLLAGFKVPVIFGQFEATELLSLDPKGMAIWSTLGNLPSLQHPGDAGASADGSVPYRFLVDELAKLTPAFTTAIDEAAARANDEHHASLDAGVRIKMVVNDQLEMENLASSIEANVPRLSNGQAQYARFPDILKAEFENVVTTSNAGSANNLVASLPHVIIALGGDEVATLVSAVEGPGGWPTNGNRPIWVLSTRSKFDAQRLSDTSKTGSLRTRIIGVDFAGDAVQMKAFRQALPASVLQAGAFDNVYDATFATAFAAGRASYNRGAATTPLTAADLVRGLDEVLKPSGAADVTVSGVGGFPIGVAAMKTGKTVFFTGTTGPWLFPTNASGGSRRMDTSYYCFHGPEPTYYVDAGGLANVLVCQRPPK